MAAEERVVVRHPEGLHARPAALLVQVASQFACDIELEANGRTGSARSLIGILKLGVETGATVTIRARGRDEAAAAARVAAFLTTPTTGGEVTT